MSEKPASFEDWINDPGRYDNADEDGTPQDYAAFVEKFKPKKTTDDCYTPPNVYEAVAAWVSETYGVERERFVRPFYPGGDYLREAYPEGCAVVDNPPFSILSKILKFYLREGIRFFLFAPTLTLFAGGANATFMPVGVSVTYANGAEVNTSFITNMDDTGARVRSCPELYRIVKRENDKNLLEGKKELPKYEYPDEVVTSAFVAKLAKYGVDFCVGKDESLFIRGLESQKEKGKSIFGGGFLISERAAAERAAAERAAAERWTLSDREREAVRRLGKINNAGEIGGNGGTA